MDKMFQAALFDLDGVVLDTESQYTTFWAGVFERYYGDGETYAQKIKGQTLTQIYHAYFDGDQQRQQLITSQLVDFEHNMGFPYIPGFEGRTRQTLWRAVQMLTQKLSCQTIHDCPKVVPLHYESEWQ